MKKIKIYIVWDMDAESWQGRRTVQSIHQTLEGALDTIPENIKTPTYDREAKAPYVKDFAYVAIEEREIGR